MLRKLCTNHASAGDYRTEYGVRPELQGLEITAPNQGTVYCKTYNTTYEDPDNYDDPKHPELVTMGEYVSIDDVDTQLPLF
jgi:hypothetical protein